MLTVPVSSTKLANDYLMTAAKPKWLEVYQMVGERVRAERKRQRITQDELASSIGLTRTSITNIEKGRQKVLLHTLVQIADYLGTSPARLLPPVWEKRVSVAVPQKVPPQVRNWIIHSIGTSNKIAKNDDSQKAHQRYNFAASR